MDPVVTAAVIAALAGIGTACINKGFDIHIQNKSIVKLKEGESVSEKSPRERISKDSYISEANKQISDYWESLPSKNQFLFLNYVIEPSRKQKASVFIYISIWPKKIYLDELIEKAEFFLGPAWRSTVFKAKKYDGKLGFKTTANGSLLCVCRITFKDSSKEQLILHQYVDISILDR